MNRILLLDRILSFGQKMLKRLAEEVNNKCFLKYFLFFFSASSQGEFFNMFNIGCLDHFSFVIVVTVVGCMLFLGFFFCFVFYSY